MFKDKSLRKALILILVILVIFSFISVYLSNSHIKENPTGTVGNTAGNLNNSGLFLEHNGKVYFSNTFEDGALYCMNPDETKIKRLSNSIPTSLLGGGDYIYYFQKGTVGKGGFVNVTSNIGFYRCDLNANNPTTIAKEVIVRAQLVDNDLYLLSNQNKNISFYKLSIDRSKRTDLAAYDINPACAYDSSIYYSLVKDRHNLYSLNTKTGVPEVVLAKGVWCPMIVGQYVYYIDIFNNYRLCRYPIFANADTAEEEILTQDRVDCFNIGEGHIYYQKNSETNPALICMSLDGSNPIIVAEGIYTHINMTSQYVYFHEFGDETNWYHSPIGTNTYSLFTAAKDVAPETE